MATETTHLPAGLYLLPSPLGHLGDLTLRVVDTLRGCGLVLAEDTRRSLKLLNHLNLRKPVWSYRAENHRAVWPKIRAALAEGRAVALLTDAGCPAVSDPGAELTRAVLAEGFAVFPLPGPSAVTCALMASGFPADRFTFGGFLPARKGERRAAVSALAGLPHTLVFFEAPHRLAEALTDLADLLGPRPAVLAREMTKLHEEFLRGSLAELAAEAARRPFKGEMTLVVSGAAAEEKPPALDEAALSARALADPRPTKALAAVLAGETGRGRAEMYALVLKARAGKPPCPPR